MSAGVALTDVLHRKVKIIINGIHYLVSWSTIFVQGIFIRYRLPQRTTLLLPEEPEYNEMNSAMKNLLLLMKTARRRIRQAVGFVQTCCGYRACSSAAGTRSTLLMSAPRPRSFSTMFS